jgi:hypothetical protein
MIALSSLLLGQERFVVHGREELEGFMIGQASIVLRSLAGMLAQPRRLDRPDVLSVARYVLRR